MKMVIDGDQMKCLEKFSIEETPKVLKKYQEDGRWEDVGVDNDGDIVVYKEL